MFNAFVGWDRRERAAYMVCVHSLLRHATVPLDLRILHEPHLRATGLYRRPTEERDGQLWDAISDAPMSTEFAISRFLIPLLADWRGWALFCDPDFYWRADVAELFALADPRTALLCVKHDHRPREALKMDGQAQTAYPRKNWSSLMLWNCAHPAHRALTLETVNSLPGRDLHRFCWLDDALIGALPPEWNWLVGVSEPAAEIKAAHFTLGTPDYPGCAGVPLAEEWRAELAQVESPGVDSPTGVVASAARQMEGR